MSISSEITRISNAKTAIAESIANKGVTVPSGTKIDGMATLIDSIPTGGSGGDTSETWVLNESLNLINLSVSINFVSHNMSFIKFEVFNEQRSITRAGDISAAGLKYYTTSQNSVTIDPSLTSWKTNPYRKVTFATAPTGDLLTWLQSNAVKQASDTAVQPSKALTVTSNGTTTITPDAPYDAIKQVDLTVNVTSGGGETTSLTVHADETNIDKVLFCLWQTSNGWMGTSNFESTTNFTVPNVIVGGYVIFTRNPSDSLYFSITNAVGVENVGVEPMDTEWDIGDGALVLKVTASSPYFVLSLRPS